MGKLTKRDNFLIYGSPDIGAEEIAAVTSVMESGWLGTGPKSIEFQNAFSAYKKVSNSLAVNSATSALHLSLRHLNFEPGDEVITTANTFCATINSIIHAGGIPVLVDIDPKTLNIDPNRIEEKITKRTKAILPVHFAGLACNMDPIMQIAKKYQLNVIEDCAHAIETTYNNVPAGTIGDFGCFSFYVTKNITTAEGGMLITNNSAAMDRIRNLSLHGMSRDAWKRYSDEGFKHYDVVDIGFKYNLTDIQSAIGLVQLKNVNKKWEKRRQIWDFYNKELGGTGLIIPSHEYDPNNIHAYHLYTVQVSDVCKYSRDEMIEKLKEYSIGVGIHYNSVACYSAYKKLFNWDPEHFPVALNYGKQTISLPLSSKLSNEDICYVVESLKEILS